MSFGTGISNDAIITGKRVAWSLLIVAAIVIGVAARTGYISV